MSYFNSDIKDSPMDAMNDWADIAVSNPVINEPARKIKSNVVEPKKQEIRRKSNYHEKEIRRGVYGELSKIQEELDEAIDAQERGHDLMLLIELSDMVGAIEGVSKKYGFTIEQLLTFARLRTEVAKIELA